MQGTHQHRKEKSHLCPVSSNSLCIQIAFLQACAVTIYSIHVVDDEQIKYMCIHALV